MSVETTHVSEVEETSQTHDAPAAESQPATTSDRPGQRMKIGSEREGGAVEAKANPVTPGAPVATAKPAAAKREPKHYPPPNVATSSRPSSKPNTRPRWASLSLENLMGEEAGGGPPPELAEESRVTGKVAKIHREDVFIDLRESQSGHRADAAIRRAAGRRRGARIDRHRDSMPKKACTNSRGRPRRSTSAIGMTSAKGKSSKSRSRAATKVASSARYRACEASSRWASYRCIASKTPKNTSASGCRASSPKRTATGKTWS